MSHDQRWVQIVLLTSSLAHRRKAIVRAARTVHQVIVLEAIPAANLGQPQGAPRD
jgi:hypothetical protein